MCNSCSPFLDTCSQIVQQVHDKRYHALPTFMYCKRQKLGRAWEQGYITTKTTPSWATLGCPSSLPCLPLGRHCHHEEVQGIAFWKPEVFENTIQRYCGWVKLGTRSKSRNSTSIAVTTPNNKLKPLTLLVTEYLILKMADWEAFNGMPSSPYPSNLTVANLLSSSKEGRVRRVLFVICARLSSLFHLLLHSPDTHLILPPHPFTHPILFPTHYHTLRTYLCACSHTEHTHNHSHHQTHPQPSMPPSLHHPPTNHLPIHTNTHTFTHIQHLHTTHPKAPMTSHLCVPMYRIISNYL